MKEVACSDRDDTVASKWPAAALCWNTRIGSFFMQQSRFEISDQQQPWRSAASQQVQVQKTRKGSRAQPRVQLTALKWAQWSATKSSTKTVSNQRSSAGITNIYMNSNRSSSYNIEHSWNQEQNPIFTGFVSTTLTYRAQKSLPFTVSSCQSVTDFYLSRKPFRKCSQLYV